MDLQTGQILNARYRIDSQIGHGSLGAVYAAWDLNLNTAVVVKEQNLTSPEAVRKFARMARSLASLRHPGLPYVIDHFSISDESQCLVTEFINGQDLNSLLVRSVGGLLEKDVLPWMLQVCDALAYLHSQDPPIQHRDIKPVNIRITPQSQAVLVDYGIGLSVDPGLATIVAGSPGSPAGSGMGNPYDPPESYGGFADARSDLYSLGAVMYFALSGRPPLEGPARQSGSALPSLRQLSPAVSPACEAVVSQAMHLSPDARFQNALALRSALESALSQASSARQQAVIVQPSGGLGKIPQTAAIPYVQAEPPTPSTIPAPQPAVAQALSPAPGRYMPLDDHRKHTSRRSTVWLWVAAVVALLVCLAAGGVGGYGMFLSAGSPTRTPSIDQAAAVAATLTMDEALRLAGLSASATAAPSYTPQSSATLSPSETPTLAPSATPSFTPTPTWTASPTPTSRNVWMPCTGTYPSRLFVGDTAMVSMDPPLPNRVRSQPNIASPIVGYVQPGETVQVVGGPVCSNQWIWWQITSLSAGITGWTAEGDSGGYWLIPQN